MANETIAQVPTDVTDPVILKRFLSRLVERLDITLGFRGDDAYAKCNDKSRFRQFLKSAPADFTEV